MSTDLKKYTEALLTCRFPQFELLSPSRFRSYLDERDIHTSEDELEYFEKAGILLPVIRLQRRQIDDKFPKYAGIMADAYSLQKAYSDNLVSFPTTETYKPWKDYRDGYEESVFSFYHPYQMIVIHRFLNWTKLTMGAQYVLELKDPVKPFQKNKEFMTQSIATLQKSLSDWNKKVGLLMLLQEAYAPQAEGHFMADFFEKDNFEKWVRWKESEFSPKQVLQQSGLSLEEVKKFYEYIAVQAQMSDPLGAWYILTRLIARSEIRNLKGRALLAQDYYTMARMVASFLEDLTGEKQLEPDDMMDGRRGSWKPMIFGEPFDYSSQQTRKAILDHYLEEPTLRFLLLYEGDTEETVINLILEALSFNTKRQGVLLYNYKGTGGLDSRNVTGVLNMAINQSVSVFVISDSDEDAQYKIDTLIKTGKLKSNMYHIWKGDFEQENFGLDLILSIVNEKIASFNTQLLSFEDVKTEIAKGKRMMKAIDDACNSKLHLRLNHVISKPELAKKLMKNRIEEIRKECNNSGWKPKLPIEHVLQRAFDLLNVK